MPFVPSSFLFLVAMPGAASSFLLLVALPFVPSIFLFLILLTKIKVHKSSMPELVSGLPFSRSPPRRSPAFG